MLPSRTTQYNSLVVACQYAPIEVSIILVLLYEFDKIKFIKKIRDLSEGILTTTLECFLCSCEAIIEPYSHLGDSVQFIEFDENRFILEKTRISIPSKFMNQSRYSTLLIG